MTGLGYAVYFPLLMRQNLPYARLLCCFKRIASAELIYELCQCQQIRHTEEGTMLTYDNLWIRSLEIRPLRRNRADGRIIDLQQETSSIAVVPLAHGSELFATQGVKRVGDAHKTRRCDRRTCILD
jgi:hypothetical protein